MKVKSMDGPTNPPAWQTWLKAAPVTPPLTIPDDVQAWKTQRGAIRERLGHLLGNLPARPSKPLVTTLSREDKGDFICEKFTFNNGAGATVPGYLLLPKPADKKHPAILYCHWHGGEYSIGKEELFQKAHTPEVPAESLTRKGYVVIAIDAYCFGERSGQGPGGPQEKGGAEELSASKFNLWVGRSLWGMILRDDLMALDYLVSRPEVDASRIGVTGISMGATRSWWLMALDDRIKAGVAVACLTRYQNLIAHEMLRAHGIYYFVPGFLNEFDTEAVVSLAAPRALLCMTGDQDGGSPPDGVQEIGRIVEKTYRLYNKETAFQSLLYPGLGHVYTSDMWEKMLAWMDANLK